MIKNISLLMLLTGSFLYAQNTAFFDQGNTHYNEGNYQEAIDSYEKVLEGNLHSAALYFNLANAHYKLNHIAPSIYYYEKTLLLDPNHEDALNNIAFAQQMTVDAIDILPKDQFSQSFESLVKSFTSDQWAYAAVIFMWIAFLCFVTYFFSKSAVFKRTFFGGIIVVLLLAIVSVSISIMEVSKYNSEQPAIVFEKVSFRAEPNVRSEILFQLHEGTKVRIDETINNWSKVSLSDGNVGWLLTDAVKKIKE
ncbi:MAG: tetratricopeptide repeat protein [Flavobacteriaceae bacterium]|nr:tetratricopeptide repeat protein [Flavobacteriaceae bacterium]MDG2314632.1 tetratricopeptide repeat protein [Flavobacteriaceae bacterium]